MKLLFLFVMLLVLAFAIYYLGQHLYSDLLEITGIIVGLVMAAIILVSFVGLIVEHSSINVKVNERNYVQKLVDESKDASDEEKAVVMKRKVEFNEDLAEYKYFTKSDWVGIFYPSKVAELPYIK